MSNHNISRLTEDVKREISAAMPQLKDKHIANGLVTVTDVEITNDLSFSEVNCRAITAERSSKCQIITSPVSPRT